MPALRLDEAFGPFGHVLDPGLSARMLMGPGHKEDLGPRRKRNEVKPEVTKPAFGRQGTLARMRTRRFLAEEADVPVAVAYPGVDASLIAHISRRLFAKLRGYPFETAAEFPWVGKLPVYCVTGAWLPMRIPANFSEDLETAEIRQGLTEAFNSLTAAQAQKRVSRGQAIRFFLKSNFPISILPTAAGIFDHQNQPAGLPLTEFIPYVFKVASLPAVAPVAPPLLSRLPKFASADPFSDTVLEPECLLWLNAYSGLFKKLFVIYFDPKDTPEGSCDRLVEFAREWGIFPDLLGCQSVRDIFKSTRSDISWKFGSATFGECVLKLVLVYLQVYGNPYQTKLHTFGRLVWATVFLRQSFVSGISGDRKVIVSEKLSVSDFSTRLDEGVDCECQICGSAETLGWGAFNCYACNAITTGRVAVEETEATGTLIKNVIKS